MRVDSFALKTIWSSALRDLAHRKPSFFVTSLVAPGSFWFFGGALAGLSEPISLAGLAALAGLAVLGVGSSLLQLRWKSRRKTSRPSGRVVISVQQAYYSGAILLMSFYCMVLALQIALRVAGPFYVASVVLFALSTIAGLLWAPHSLPKKPEDLALAASRDIRWLPRVIAVQSGLTSLGVFLGVWISRGTGTWAYFLVMGLSALLAMIMMTLGLSMFYRFLVFLFNPPPAEAPKDAG